MANRYSYILDNVLKEVVEKAKKDDNWSAWEQSSDFSLKDKIKAKYSTPPDFGVIDAIFDKLKEDGLIKNIDSLSPTIEGILFSDKGGYDGQEKRLRLIRWAKRTEILSLCFGAIMAGLFSVWSYNHDTKVEYLKIQNTTLEARAQQWESQIDMYIDKSRNSYQKENELLLLRDSLRKAK